MIILLLLPTIIMLFSLPFWQMKKLHNKFFKILVGLAYFGLPAIIFFSCASQRDDTSSPGIIGGLFIGIVILALNGFQYRFYLRKLNNNRCPHCHSLGLKVMNKDVDTYTNTHTTIYSVKGGRYNGKQYSRVVENIRKFTTYSNYCGACNSVIVWTEESEDTLTSDSRPKSIR